MVSNGFMLDLIQLTIAKYVSIVTMRHRRGAVVCASCAQIRRAEAVWRTWVINEEAAAAPAAAARKRLLVSALVVGLLAATGAYLSGSLGFAEASAETQNRAAPFSSVQ